MRLDSPIDLVAQLIQGLYHAENQLILALPRVAIRVNSDELRQSLENHLDETREHALRLEHAADALEVPCCGMRCFAMEGLLKEGDIAQCYGGDPELIDQAIIHVCQGIEHYEIVSYQTLIAQLESLGHDELVELFTMILNEEQAAAKGLKKAAQLSERSSTPG